MLIFRYSSFTLRQAARKLKEIIKLQNIESMTEAVTSLLPTNITSSVNGKDGISGNNPACAEKRQCEEGTTAPLKKQKTEGDPPEAAGPKINRKKVVMLLVYCGKGYLGMQRNPGAKTIESDLMEALLKAQLASQEHVDNPNKKMHFQRAARTDKGVSAAGQICSLMMDVNVPNPVNRINEHLVEQIRVIAIQRVTKRFDSKNAASARTYQYLLPTYAFTPVEEFVLEKYRIADDVFQKVNETLALFKGTKNFHNFTSGKKPNDPSAKRYIMEFSMGTPFVRKGVEFAVISVKGQSFMLHQIRKMIGLTIAIVRGLTGTETIEKAYGSDKCDVPKAPGLGLMLDRVHYDYYNKRFGEDGMHEPILWEKYESEINKFKEDHIYPSIIDTELEEKSMMKWLATLHLHHFDTYESPEELNTPLLKATCHLRRLAKEKASLSDNSAEDELSPSVTQLSTEASKDADVMECASSEEKALPPTGASHMTESEAKTVSESVTSDSQLMEAESTTDCVQPPKTGEEIHRTTDPS